MGLDYGHTPVAFLLLLKAFLLPGSQVGQVVTLQPSYPTHGVRRQQSDAVCILSPMIHLPMGDSQLPSCFSTAPRDLAPLFQQRIGAYFTLILQSCKQNKKTQSPTYLKRIPEKTDGYKSDMVNKKLLLSAMTVVHQKWLRVKI